jgi:hypothetical protein
MHRPLFARLGAVRAIARTDPEKRFRCHAEAGKMFAVAMEASNAEQC